MEKKILFYFKFLFIKEIQFQQIHYLIKNYYIIKLRFKLGIDIDDVFFIVIDPLKEEYSLVKYDYCKNNNILFYEYSFVKKQLCHSGNEVLFLNLKKFNKIDDFIVKKMI